MGTGLRRAPGTRSGPDVPAETPAWGHLSGRQQDPRAGAAGGGDGTTFTQRHWALVKRGTRRPRVRGPGAWAWEGAPASILTEDAEDAARTQAASGKELPSPTVIRGVTYTKRNTRGGMSLLRPLLRHRAGRAEDGLCPGWTRSARLS